MKNLILIITITLLSATANAQKDYSKDIVRYADDLKGEIEYRSPLPPINETSIYVDKLIKFDTGSTVLLFHVMGLMTNYNAKGLYIKFDDGEVLRYPDAPVSCNYSASNDRAYFGCALTISAENYDKFASKKVVEFSLDDNKGIPGKKNSEKLPAYIKYIYHLTK